MTRTRDPNDRRRVTLQITPEFGPLAWSAYGPLGEMGGPFIAELSDDELRAIVLFLRRGDRDQPAARGQLLAEAAEAEPAPANDSDEG